MVGNFYIYTNKTIKDMKKLILPILIFLSNESFTQSYHKAYAEQKALEIVTEKPHLETYVVDFDKNGDMIYGERQVLPFNYGVLPVLLDSIEFYSLRDSFISDSNLVFAELKITDFDNTECYECDSVVNPNYLYQRTGYRDLYGYASDENKIKNEKFIYYFVGTTNGGLSGEIYYLHALIGTNRDL